MSDVLWLTFGWNATSIANAQHKLAAVVRVSTTLRRTAGKPDWTHS